MSEDQDQQRRPMANMLAAARGGHIAMDMKPERFIYVDRAAQRFLDTIEQIKNMARQVSEQEHWGLGEDNPDMISAVTMVSRFRDKAMGAPDGNSIYEIMDQHRLIVEDIRETFRIVRDRMMQADSEFAAEFTHLDETLTDRAPVAPEAGPYLLPDGSTR